MRVDNMSTNACVATAAALFSDMNTVNATGLAAGYRPMSILLSMTPSGMHAEGAPQAGGIDSWRL